MFLHYKAGIRAFDVRLKNQLTLKTLHLNMDISPALFIFMGTH
jgi:hypothetical protein